MKKKLYKFLLFCLPFATLTTSCKDYLSIPLEATKEDKDIFGDYYNFQGYVDRIYALQPNPIGLTMDVCYGGETVSTTTWTTGYNSVRGLYNQYLTRGYLCSDATYDKGIWYYGWDAIRAANVALANFDLLQGTDEEKNLIKGQLLFLRAFYHQEILAAWGSIPYIDKVLVEDLKLPRFAEYTALDGKTYKGYQACAIRIAEDFEEASRLLPDVWENDALNRGRCTSIAAKAYKAKALLYAASPLMNEYSCLDIFNRNIDEVNVDMMRMAAEAASDALEIANAHPDSYGLLDWEHYSDMFYTVEPNTVPITKETLWSYRDNAKGAGNVTNKLGRVLLPDSKTFGGNAVNNTVTQNYVDLFEMSDGSLYKQEYDGVTYTGADGKQKCKMWDDRDPRFRRAIYVDRDNAGYIDKTILNLYTGGSTRNADNCLTPYYIHKFWAKGVSKVEGGSRWNNFRYVVPSMRLAEVYLIYAEAVYQALGDANQKIGECGLSALEAVNKVRNRAGHVSTDDHGGAHGDFIKMILNERAVELCFEGQYWYDIRRYKLGHEMNQEPIQTLNFNKDWTNFSRSTIVQRTFTYPKQYWVPFPTNITKMYEGFPQNIGWE